MTNRFKQIMKPLVVVGVTFFFLVACSANAQENTKPVVVFKENITFEQHQVGVESNMIHGVTREAVTENPVNLISNPEAFIDIEASHYDSVSFTPQIKPETKDDNQSEGLEIYNGNTVMGMSDQSFIHTDVIGENFEVKVYARLGDEEVVFIMTYDVVDTKI